MTGTAHVRRGDVLRAVVKEANSRLDGTLPTDVAGVAETFRDDLDLVGALQLHWHTLMAGNIERAIAEEPGRSENALDDTDGNLELAVLRAWRAAQEELPGVRLVLDSCTDQPTSQEMGEAMDIANRKEWALLAVMAGKASAHDSDAAEVGRVLEAKVRRPGFEIPEREEQRLSLRERLRIVLAA